MAHIYPSLISANLLNLQTEIQKLDPYCIGYHLDIMDNHFVPNLTWGPAFIDAIGRGTTRQLWVHLMVDNPLSWVEKLTLPANSTVSFHIETKDNVNDIIKFIHDKKWRASITLSPKTNVEAALPVANVVDQVLVMSVEPGYSGQQFLPHVVTKVQELVAYRAKHTLKFSIAMDGGINKDNIAMLAHEGVEDFAIAHAIFGQPDAVKALQELQQLLK